MFNLFLTVFSTQIIHAQAEGDDVVARRAALEKDLAELEIEIEAQQALLQDKQRDRVSYERDVAILGSANRKNKTFNKSARYCYI